MKDLKKHPRVTVDGLRLYLVADPSFMRGKSVEEVVAQAVENGVNVIQLREKNCSNEEFVKLAFQFSEVLKNSKIPLIINDRLDVAKQVNAQGIHLGQSDLPWQEARRVLGSEAIIGVSVETLEQARNLTNSDIDYLGVSGLFPSGTKPELKKSWGLKGLKKLRNEIDLPLIGIGGIDASNVVPIIQAGADGIAVVSAITGAVHPGKATTELRDLISTGLARTKT